MIGSRTYNTFKKLDLKCIFFIYLWAKNTECPHMLKYVKYK